MEVNFRGIAKLIMIRILSSLDLFKNLIVHLLAIKIYRKIMYESPNWIRRTKLNQQISL